MSDLSDRADAQLGTRLIPIDQGRSIAAPRGFVPAVSKRPRSDAAVSQADVTELADLRQRNLQLAASLMLAQANLIRAQEDERRRVASDLHDTAAQHLIGVNLGLAHLREIAADPEVAALAADLAEMLQQFHRELRGITYTMHPPALLEHGLHASVRALCEGLAKRSGLEVSLSIYGEDRMRGTAVETAIYRIVQEALANVQLHAQARRVRVRLGCHHAVFVVAVADDGIGFPSGYDAHADHGVGLAGMTKRMTDLGGQFRAGSRRGHRGGIVVATAPREGAGQAFVPAPLSLSKPR